MCKRALVLLILAVCAAVPAASQGRYGRDNAVQPLDRILPLVRNGRPGRFYDAEGPFPDPNGGYHYRIKWLTPAGRVVWLDTDARTGRVIGIARSDWREHGPPPYFEGRPEMPPEPGRYRHEWRGHGR